MDKDPRNLSATAVEDLGEAMPIEEPPVPTGEVIEHDVDPATWLEKDDSTRTATVMTSAGPLRIAAINDDELDKLMALAKTKVDRTNPRGERKIDTMRLRRLLITYSINKAYGYENPPGNLHQPDKALSPTNPKLLRKLTGELTKIQKEVQSLSGLDDDNEKPKPEDFLD